MESLSVESVLGLTGLIILVGLAGELIFKRTGIPSVLFLMGFGVLLGPVLHLADPTVVMQLAPYLGTLALLIILFDGGINLHIVKVVNETPLALLFSLTVCALTVVSIMGFEPFRTFPSMLGFGRITLIKPFHKLLTNATVKRLKLLGNFEPFVENRLSAHEGLGKRKDRDEKGKAS